MFGARFPVEAELRHQVERVVRCFHLHVIIEVHIDVAPGLMPGADAPRPVRERAIGVPAGIDLNIAVQTHVHEVGRDVEHLRPLARSVGDDETDIALAQERDEIVVHEARVPDFHRMAQRPVLIDRQARAAVHAGVPPPREPQRVLHRFRKRIKERRQAIAPVGEHRRELPEERSELVPKGQNSGSKKVRERLLDLGEPQHVRDVARPLHREQEPWWRVAIPLLVVLRALQRVKRAVDLDAGKVPAAELELAALRQPFGIPDPAPWLVAPARNADPHHGPTRT